MLIKIIAVGKTKARYWQLAESQYVRRIQRYAELRQLIIKDATREAISNPELAKDVEGENILRKILGDDYVVALDSHGQQLSSEQFAEFFQTRTMRGIVKFAFVIGGPLGLSADILKKANEVLSLSKMTLPHELSRVMLLEQIYRAFSILRNEKYHK